MKPKLILSICIPVIVTVLLLGVLTLLVMPKYMTETQEGAMMEEYYQETSGHDVVFIGDCEVYENFSPVTLWNEAGIPSYIRGSAQQLIWQTYYLMDETFRYETPKVMVFNVLEMIYDSPESTGDQEQREAYNRMTLDGMKWSADKVYSIQESMTEEERSGGGMWNYIFPILRFHDRITDLSEEDVRYLFHKDLVTDNGYLMQVGVNPVLGEYRARPLVDYTFGEKCYEYLDKMKALCESHGTQLVLIKAPSLSPVWYDEWEEQIKTYAKENDLLYINFLEKQTEIGINWDSDTYDRGLHLNVYGAEKLSKYFAEILQKECGLEDRRDDAQLSALWKEKTKQYEERKARLEGENK